MSALDLEAVAQLVKQTLAEDVGAGDVTAALIPSAQQASATIITREKMVLCGRPWVEAVFQQLDPGVVIDWRAAEGDSLVANQTICTLTGASRSLLTGERAALNLLQTLSATATITKHYTQFLTGTACQLLDTRKTLPGLRAAQKYAVACGGGRNHRIGLYDAYLIKENHIAACGSIAAALREARHLQPDILLEIEVENLMEYHEALAEKPDIIMLDNFSLADVKAAVQARVPGVKLEISGNVDETTIRDYAETGIDYISVGALTKHVRAIDLSCRINTQCD